LYATGAADVDPSVAPPKFVAKFESLHRAKRNHPRTPTVNYRNPTNTTKTALSTSVEPALCERAPRIGSPNRTLPALPLRGDQSPRSPRMRPSHHDDRSSLTDTHQSMHDCINSKPLCAATSSCQAHFFVTTFCGARPPAKLARVYESSRQNSRAPRELRRECRRTLLSSARKCA
jgi:hypothetical protein